MIAGWLLSVPRKSNRRVGRIVSCDQGRPEIYTGYIWAMVRFDQLSKMFNNLGTHTATVLDLRRVSMQAGSFLEDAIYEAIHAGLATLHNPPGQPEHQLIDASRIALTEEGIALGRRN